MILDQARQARQRLGHLLGHAVSQREMSAMLGLSDGWRHYEAGRRRMSNQLAAHVRLLLRVHEHRAAVDKLAAEVKVMIGITGWMGPHCTLPQRIRDAATKLAGDQP